MLEALTSLCDTTGFMPHGYCFLWTPILLWTYVVSDAVIVVAYFSIPFSLWYFAERRPDLPFRPIFVMFGLFVLACGTSHLFAILNIWYAAYWPDAWIKLLTAVVSIATAVMLWKLMPRALALPSRTQLAKANHELQEEVSRRVKVEGELRLSNDLLTQRTAQLEAANRELDSFVYAVSHDLRAPLRAMSGFSQALIEDYRDRLDGEAVVYLDQISAAGQHMGQLVDGLLTLSRSVRANIRRDSVDVSALADHIRDDLSRTDPSRQVSWRIEPGLFVSGDAQLVELVLRNLLANAWKYTGGTKEPVIRVFAGRDQGADWICVADNGAGFAMSHVDRLFKPFQRLHRQDEFPGIGIGLATVQRIITRHGGSIRAEGAIGQGATFSFCLPAADGGEDGGS